MPLLLKVLLPKAVLKSADAADALAVAVCHAHMRGVRDLGAQLLTAKNGM